MTGEENAAKSLALSYAFMPLKTKAPSLEMWLCQVHNGQKKGPTRRSAPPVSSGEADQAFVS